MSSIQIMSAIYSAPVLHSREREVLLVLANHAGSKGERLGRAYPSQQLLAAELCIGIATVERAMRQLYAMRVIMKYSRSGRPGDAGRASSGVTNEYEINIKWLRVMQRRFEDLRDRLREEEGDKWFRPYQEQCKKDRDVLYREGVPIELISPRWLNMAGMPDKEELAKLAASPRPKSVKPKECDANDTIRLRGEDPAPEGPEEAIDPSAVRGQDAAVDPSDSQIDPSDSQIDPSAVRGKPLEPLEPDPRAREPQRREVTGEGKLDGDAHLWTCQAIATVEWCRSGRWPDGDGDPLLPHGRTLGIGPSPDDDAFDARHFMFERLVRDEILPALRGSRSISAIPQIQHGVGPKLRAALRGEDASIDKDAAKARCKSLEAVADRLYQEFMKAKGAA